MRYGANSETAIGYTCYMDTILRASSFISHDKKVLVPFDINNKTKKDLIKKGYSLFKSFDENVNLKKEAKKYGIQYFLSKKSIKKI